MYGSHSKKQILRGFSDPDVEELLATGNFDYFNTKVRALSESKSSGEGRQKENNLVLNYSSKLVPSQSPSPYLDAQSSTPISSSTSKISSSKAQALAELREDASRISENLQVITSRTPIQNSVVIDVRPARAVHVTQRCIHGIKGGSCGAIHCGLSASLPSGAAPSPASSVSSFASTNLPSPSEPPFSPVSSAFSPNFAPTPTPTFEIPSLASRPTSLLRYHSRPEPAAADTATSAINLNSPLTPTAASISSQRSSASVDVSALDDILAGSDSNMENKTTTQWKSSFQSMRNKFNTGPNRPVPLKLGGDPSAPGWYDSLPRSKSNQILSILSQNPIQKSQSGHDVSRISKLHKDSAHLSNGDSTTQQIRNTVDDIGINSHFRPSSDALEGWQQTLKQNKARNTGNFISQSATLPRRATAAAHISQALASKPISFAELNAVMEEQTSNRSQNVTNTQKMASAKVQLLSVSQQPNRFPTDTSISLSSQPLTPKKSDILPGNYSAQQDYVPATVLNKSFELKPFPKKESESLPSVNLTKTSTPTMTSRQTQTLIGKESTSSSLPVGTTNASSISTTMTSKTTVDLFSGETRRSTTNTSSSHTLSTTGTPNKPQSFPTVNFSSLDRAVEAVNELAGKQTGNARSNKPAFMQRNNGVAEIEAGGGRPFKAAEPVELKLINDISHFLQKNIGAVNGPRTKTFPVDEKDKRDPEISRLTENSPSLPVILTSGGLGVLGEKFHSPSPDNSSTTSDNPSGLPHPKPKHSLREQLQSLGVEPRSPNWNKVAKENFSFTTHPWALGSVGTVADRIAQLEKFPTVPATLQLQPAGAASVPTSATASSKQFSSIFKSRPIIHLNLSKSRADSPPISPLPAENIPSPLLQKEQPSQASSELNKNNNNVHIFPSRVPASKPSSSSTTSQKENVPHRYRFPGGKSLADKIPRFYFPKGKPSGEPDTEVVLKRVAAVISHHSDKSGHLNEDNASALVKACALPLYWKRPIFLACGGAKGFITFQEFSSWWRRMSEHCHDDASRFLYTLAGPCKDVLERDDFEPLVQDVVDSFPGLYFLRDAPEFHSRYVQTVIARIFYTVNRSWSGKITANELRRSNFLDVIRSLEDTEDINTVMEYFSYEHFYVIYCKFWEIDRDHDLFIDKHDLARHDNGAISGKIIDRIFSGAVTRGGKGGKIERMSYADFVAFLIAEEDKKHPTRENGGAPRNLELN